MKEPCKEQGKRLRRRWARLCWLLIVFGAGLVIFGGLRRMIPLWIVGVFLLIAGMILQRSFLRCTNCGKDLARPMWVSRRRYYCKFCGKPFLFDDDPPDPSTTTETREEP